MKLFSLRTKVIMMISFAVGFVVWLLCFINVNVRFPKAEIIQFNMHETFEEGGLEYSVQESSIISGYDNLAKHMSDRQVLVQLQHTKDKMVKFLYTELKVTNKGTGEVNAWGLGPHFAADCYPSAWGNGPMYECSDNVIQPGGSCVIRMVFILDVPEDADLSKEEFHLVYRTYPQKIQFILDV